MAEKSFTSLSGLTEQTAEPSENTSQPPTPRESSSATPKLSREASSNSLTAKRLPPKRAASATNSPILSRESSPVRPGPKTPSTTASTTRIGRSRKNSTNDITPASSSTSANPNPNPPSAAAQQRALSVASIPTLKPVQADPTGRPPVAPKPSVTSELAKEITRWPTLPSLRSPTPASKLPALVPRKFEQESPAISVHRASVQSPEVPEPEVKDNDVDDTLTVPGARTPVRGSSNSSSMLETVQEVSQPNTPGNGLDGVSEKTDYGFTEETVDNAMGKVTKSRVNNESGSESGGKSSIKMKPAVTRVAPATKYSSNTSAGRGKPSGEGSMSNMTIETETVSSIPQIVMAGTGGGNNGSIRAKPSSETIRPKKDKKKTARKTPSVASGTASSKADIFEAKVASAVDEANSSDSEETFVYESNPPDIQDRPRRYHSRTPSATSMASTSEQRGGVRSMMDHGRSVAMKKSMKFANTYTSNPTESVNGEDDGKGTIRSSNTGTARGTAHHHHHIGRWGRNNANGHASLFDNESPFPNASTSELSGTRHSSRPDSPRVSTTKLASNGKKSSILPYDSDAIADDERQPLISSIRSGRSGRNRRPPSSSLRQWEYQAHRHNTSCIHRYAGCLVLTLVVMLVTFSCIGLMLATTRPLSDVKVLALKNVLASEQDIIFDMKVEARNPNLVGVSIENANLVIFAKSKYAGTNAQWWSRPQIRSLLRWARRLDDDGTQTPDDGDPDAPSYPNLEIGHVYSLDSPLSFDGSPFHHAKSESLGQIRINHPGNHTIPAGSERWGRVLQHGFDLIVRGTLKYTLPFSVKVQSISVEGRVTVEPNAAESEPEDVVVISRSLRGN
ncbi:vacuolar segregation subunit 7-domain-containing protein [Calycina marina]|uniref:Vacuolar segregation subunit 7-domain-containing protein n=1 Tax=Calycina marina TaxID=1763456 RepID=A0A9P7Z351_9HELO|nr:vacuolar segregation subunit 7-domain-containing protein [Calycina marina]